MGDRYELALNCRYCGHYNEEIWFAPTCDVNTFKCKNCEHTNFINVNFKTICLEDVKLKDIKDNFVMATSASWSEEDIDRMSKETFQKLKEITIIEDKNE